MKENTWPVAPAGKGYQVMLPTGANQSLEAHYVNSSVTTCSCHRGSRCPAVREVRSYLATGGQKMSSEEKQARTNNSQIPSTCPICGAAVKRDRFGGRKGWRCEEGGLIHYYQARYGHLKDWFTRPASERLIVLATPQERAMMALTYPAGA